MNHRIEEKIYALPALCNHVNIEKSNQNPVSIYTIQSNEICKLLRKKRPFINLYIIQKEINFYFFFKKIKRMNKIRIFLLLIM